MGKRVQFGGQTMLVPDDATPEEITQAVFESRATPEGLGIASSGLDARDAFRQKAMAGMEEIGSGRHPIAGYSPAMEAAQPFYGALKGLANTTTGAEDLLMKVPGMRKVIPTSWLTSPEARAEMEPVGVAQKIGYAGEQVGEFMGPGAAGKAAGGLVKVRQLIKQGRTAKGAFTAATRSPVVADVIKRLLLRGGTEAATTGLLNEAQGGDFNTGAEASVVGQGIGYATGRAAPVIKKLLQRRANTVGDILLGGGILGGGVGGEEYIRRHYSPINIAKGAAYTGAALALASPRARGPIIGSFLQVFDSHEPGTVARGRGGRIGTAR